MAAFREQPQAAVGPWGWENSRAKRDGKRQLGIVDIGCYTDVDLGLSGPSTDPVQVGPYTVLVPWSLRGPGDRPRVPRLGMVLRVEQYLGEYPDEYVDPTWEQLDPKNYHGAVAWEELAALVSLALGLRLRAGGIMQVFEPEAGGLGYPHEMDPPPYLLEPARYWSMLPGMSDYGPEPDFSYLRLLEDYPSVTLRQARALVRSARSYQESIWTAESDPRQAWLRLVTAVETAAEELRPRLSPEERLREVYPDMADQILYCGDPELAEWLTRKIADREGAQAQFLAFLKEFGPPPPRRRPRSPSKRQDWRVLDRQLKRIYQARSEDLHTGSPIPRSMCEPTVWSRTGIAPEVTYSPSGEQPRLRLHVFAYVVRHALLAWWRHIASASSPGRS